MPESSQPRTHSNLSQMTRVDLSDGPDSDSMVETPYYENMQTVSIPTKSGTEVAIRSHQQSDDPPSTCGLSSRPSSRGGELDLEDAKIIQNCYVPPSTAELNFQTSALVKPPTAPEVESAFTFGKRAFPSNAPSNSQSSQPAQSSQAVPPNSFEKSNQEHQVSARSTHQEPLLGPLSEGLDRMFSWLKSWLTLNIEAPVDFQKDMQPQRSPLFQNPSDAQLQKASPNSRGRSNTSQSSGRQHLQGPKQPRRKNIARSVAPLVRPHDRNRVSEGPTHEQSRPPTRRGSPETAFSQDTAVKDTEVFTETSSDKDDIFKVTDQEPTGSVAVSQSNPSDCVDQQDSDIEEEAHAQSKTKRVDSANVPMQDTAVPDDSLDGERLDPVSETKLTPDHSHQEHRVNPEKHLTEQPQQSGGCQRLEGEQDSTFRQHSVENQHSSNTEPSAQDNRPAEDSQSSNALRTVAPVPRTDVARRATSCNENRNIQQPPTPADTMLPTLESAKQPLREVTNRSASPRVTKNRRKSSRPGSVARNPNPSSYTSAQLTQLAEYMKEQERLQDQQKWVKSLAATQEQLEKANQHKSKLQVECAQLKVSLEKYSKLYDHLKTIVKFENGLGKDIGNLQSSRDETGGELKRVMSKVQAIHDAVASSAEQGARVIEMRATSLILLREYQVSLTSLESQKSDLERRLKEACEALSKEKSRQAAFDARLETFETLNETISKINDRLSEFKTYIEQGKSSNEACRGLFELVKKESAVISDQLRSSGTNMETMKTSVEALASGFDEHIGQLKDANNATSKTRTEAENKVVVALEAIESQLKSLEDLSEKNAALRERLVEEEQKSISSKEMIAKLEEDLTNKSNAEAGLREKVDELQFTQASLESERASAEADKARLLELTTSESNLKQDLEKLRREKVESTATISSLAEQKTTLQREKGGLQDRINETNRLLEDMRLAVPDFGPEKIRIEADAKKRIDEAVAERDTQVLRLSLDFRNEKLRLQKMKEEVDRELMRKEDDVKRLQAQLDHLKQEYSNRSAAAWSKDTQQKDTEIKRLIDQNNEASRRSQKLQQDLEQTRRSAESSLRKGAQELQQRDAQIKVFNETSTATQASIKSLEQELEQVKRSKDATVKTVQEDANRKSQDAQARLEAMEVRLSEANSAKHAIETKLGDLEKRSSDETEQRQKEISGLQQDLELADHRLEELDERHTHQEEVIRQKDSDTQRLQQETEKLQQAIVKSKQESERFKQESERFKQESERFKQESEKLRQESEKSKLTSEKSKLECEQSKLESEKLKQESEKLKQEAEKLEQETQKLKQESEKLKDETEKSKRDMQNLKREHAKALADAVQVPNSQPQQDVQDQMPIQSVKKARTAINRSGRSVSKPTSSTASTSETQPTSDVLESTQPRSTGASVFGPFSKPRSNSYNTNDPNGSSQEEEEMLDVGSSLYAFLKTTSRPVSSQSEAQRAFSLGSQEVLTTEGVRFRSQKSQQQLQSQSQLHEHASSSSSLSEPRDLDGSYRDAAREESQSQAHTQVSEQQSQDVTLQSQQQSMGLSIFNDLAVAPHAFETPMKAGGKNLQGMGKKVTPRPESQSRQSKSGALQPIATPKLPKGSAASSQQQKKVSALSSGPYNFKIGSSAKDKRVAIDIPGAEEGAEDDDDNYSGPGSSDRGSRSPQKRPAPQSSKNNKRQRTETTTAGAAAASQRSVTTTPRRSQTTSATPGTQRRRSARNSKK
ncbi:hypothetical protein E4T44_01755 [Aureobasidium sp. EXF-8845]|nr:hypothetical protein E4T44_01755 [Aureobasidium sp. EXF-8845]